MQYLGLRPNRAIGTAIIMVCLTFPAAALAQTDTGADSTKLEEITVTARKREENLMEIPVSVSVVTSEVIQDSNLLSVNDIAAVTPGFKVNNAFGRQADRPVVRGVSGISTGTELSGYFVDGVYVSGTLSSFGLDNIERVEVLRGPQSATFGRRTFAGAVNYVTARPDEDTRIRVRAGLGNNDRVDLAATVSGQARNVGYKIHARHYSYGGDFENTLAIGPDDIGAEETNSINASIYLSPSDSTEIQLNVLYADDDDGQYAVALQPSSDNNCFFPRPPNQSPGGPRPYFCGELRDDVPVSLGGFLPDDAYGVQQERFRSFVKLEHDFENIELQWISSYNTNNYYAGQDQTNAGFQTAFSFATFSQVPASAWHTRDSAETDNSSHELWLRGSAAADKLDWSIGAYYFDEEEIETDRSDGRLGEVTNTALMGALEYAFSDAFVAGLEVRFADDEVTQKPSGSTDVFNETFDSVTHRLTASYFFNDDAMGYLNWSTGTLPGAFNTNANLPPELIPIEEGELELIEIGAKVTVNPKFNFTAALYTQEWSEQVRSQFILLPGAGVPTSYQANQGTTDFDGFEFSANWSPIDNLLISAAASFNDSEVNDFISSDSTDEAITFATGDVGDVSGAQLPLSPDKEVYLGITVDTPFADGFDLRSRIDYSYQSSRFVRLTNQAETGSESVVNATFTLSKDNWSAALWGRNLTDEQAPISGLRYIEANSFFFSGRAFVITPRPGPEYGVTLSMDFL